MTVVLASHFASIAWLRRTLSEPLMDRTLPIMWFRLGADAFVLAVGWAAAWWLLLRDRQDRLEKTRLDHLAEVAMLSGGFAHEARNYLHAMQSRLELLRKNLAGQAKAEERVDKMAEITREMEQLLTDFLTFARPAEDELCETDLPNLVKQVLEFEALEMERGGIQVELTVDPKLPLVLVDRNKLKRAVLNLTVNARQAMPDGGRIDVRLLGRRRSIRIEIQDSGCGIPAEDQPRIFETYFTTKSGGCGLGLAIVKRTIEDLGGTVSYTSTPGSGTTFVIDLPNVKQHRAALRRIANEPSLRKAAG